MNTELKEIRQSEFAELHNLTAAEVRALRDTHLQEGADWFCGGPTNRTFFWTDEAAQRIAAILEPAKQPTPQDDEQDQEGQPGFQVQPEAPMPLSEVSVGEATQPDAGHTSGDEEVIETPEAKAETPLTVRVLKRARNNRFVYANLDGERIAVMVPGKQRKSLVGKNVKVSTATDDAGTITYTLIS